MSPTNEEYDFIVIGGGTSGLVVASRLSEDPKVQVLVIEAGENHLNDPRISIPALWPSLLGSDLDWSSVTIPQKELNGRAIGHPHGRVLGGSSALNAQVFAAPSQVGFDAWAKLGNKGWDWKSIAPYYQKSYTVAAPPENIRTLLELEYTTSNHQGTTGPVQTSYTGTTEGSLEKAWINTFKNLDHKLTSDPFSGTATGGFANLTTVDANTKERSYSASAYYKPAENRPNLHLITGTQVGKIIFSTISGRVLATSVEWQENGSVRTIRAKKEIILAAGTFNTSKLLELSGVGGANILQSKGIEVIIDNPNVGENFQDHPLAGISFEVVDGVPTMDAFNRQDPEAIQDAMSMYQSRKTGPFSGGAINSYALMPIDDFQSSEGQEVLNRVMDNHKPNAHSDAYEFVRSVYSANLSSAGYLMYAAQGSFGTDSTNAKNVTIPAEPGNFVTIATILSYPVSRGNVHIASSSPKDKPVIDGGYYTNPLDLEMHARHLLFAEKLASTEPLASFIKPGGKRSPPFARLNADLDTAKDYIRRTMISSWHPSGTCAMLPKDKGGVVNERLVVYGTENLRVVDASVMPLISLANTQSTVYAIAEKAADLIKEDYELI